MWTVAVGLGAGGGRGHGGPTSSALGLFVCVFSSSNETCSEHGKTKPVTQLLVYKTESLQLDYELDDGRERSKGIKTKLK